MKSERRHHLQENELAVRLNAYIERIRPHFTTIGVVLGVLVVAFIVYKFTSSAALAKKNKSWGEYTMTMLSGNVQTKKLEELAKKDPTAKSSIFSKLAVANQQLLSATQNHLLDPEGSNTILEDAKKAYTELIASTKNNQIKNQATYGLASACDVLGEIDKAKEHYAKVGGLYEPLAKSRLKELESPSALKSAKWLATAKAIIPIAPTGPGIPGSSPLFGTQFDSTPQRGSNNSGPGLDTSKFDFLGESDATESAPEKTDAEKTDATGDAATGPQPASETKPKEDATGESSESSEPKADAPEAADAGTATESDSPVTETTTEDSPATPAAGDATGSETPATETPTKPEE